MQRDDDYDVNQCQTILARKSKMLNYVLRKGDIVFEFRSGYQQGLQNQGKVLMSLDNIRDSLRRIDAFSYEKPAWSMRIDAFTQTIRYAGIVTDISETSGTGDDTNFCQVTVAVRDSGIRVSLCPQLYHPFTQLDEWMPGDELGVVPMEMVGGGIQPVLCSRKTVWSQGIGNFMPVCVILQYIPGTLLLVQC